MDTVDLVAGHEAYEGNPYNDSLGIPTIGYGTKLPITEPEAQLLLHSRLDPIMDQLGNALPWFSSLAEARKGALTDMAYQMGVVGLLAFHDTLSAIARQDWQAAHDGMLASKWAQQTPKRAQEDATMMLTGLWPDNSA